LYSQPATVTQLRTISLAQRGGDFSALCTAGFTGGICNNPVQQLFNPFSSANPATRTPYSNNFISPGTFSSAAIKIINSACYRNLDASANNTSQCRTTSSRGGLKIDFVTSSRDHVIGRWSQQFITAPNSNSIQLLGASDRPFPPKNFVLDETHT